MITIIFRRIVCMAIVLAVFSGCAVQQGIQPMNWPDKLEAKNDLLKVHDVKLTTEILIGENGLNQLQNSVGGANQAGILGFLIASAVLNSVNSDIEQNQRSQEKIRRTLRKFNLTSKFREKLASMDFSSMFGVSSVNRWPKPVIPAEEEIYSEISGNSLMLVDISLKFSDDLNVMTVRSDVKMLAKPVTQKVGNDSGSTSPIILYQNSVEIEHQFQSAGSVQWWKGDKLEQQLEQALAEAVEDLSIQLLEDMKKVYTRI